MTSCSSRRQPYPNRPSSRLGNVESAADKGCKLQSEGSSLTFFKAMICWLPCLYFLLVCPQQKLGLQSEKATFREWHCPLYTWYFFNSSTSIVVMLHSTKSLKKPEIVSTKSTQNCKMIQHETTFKPAAFIPGCWINQPSIAEHFLDSWAVIGAARERATWMEQTVCISLQGRITYTGYPIPNGNLLYDCIYTWGILYVNLQGCATLLAT